MEEVVQNSTQYLSQSDLHATATYLLTQPQPKSAHKIKKINTNQKNKKKFGIRRKKTL